MAIPIIFWLKKANSFTASGVEQQHIQGCRCIIESEMYQLASRQNATRIITAESVRKSTVD